MVQILQLAPLWLVLTGSAAACLNGHPTVEAEYRLRPDVLVATVLSERYEPETKSFDLEGVTYTARVDEVFRGRPAKTIRLFSENSSGRFPMQVGAKYLLFAYRDRGRIMVDNCGNSEIFSSASPILLAVRKLRAAEERASPSK